METKRKNQLVRSLTKSFQDWDVQKAFKISKDEFQSRINLINPFFDILNYNPYVDYIHEYNAKIDGKKTKKVDMAITLGSKRPLILVECKTSDVSLDMRHHRQLNNYCNYVKTAKIGILTNGIEYNFYIRNKQDSNNLYKTPFFTFDIYDFNSSDLEMLAYFNRQDLELDTIVSLAEEKHFMDNFDDALYKTLNMPVKVKKLTESNKEFIRLIYKNMGGKKFSQKALNEIAPLVNSISIRNTLSRIIKDENTHANKGIITTDEERKAFNVIKTILGMSSKFSNKDLERITHRDLKHSFTILVDNVKTKKICSLELKETKKSIEVGNRKFLLKNLSISSILKHKKQIVDSALKYLK